MAPIFLAQSPVSSPDMRSQTAYTASVETVLICGRAQRLSSPRSRPSRPSSRGAGRGHHHGNHAAAVRAARRATPVPGPAFCRAYPLTCGAVTTVSSRSAPAATAQRRRRRRRSTGAPPALKVRNFRAPPARAGSSSSLGGRGAGRFAVSVAARQLRPVAPGAARAGVHNSMCLARANSLYFFSAFSAGFGCIVTPRAPRRSASGVRAGIERDLRKCAARESRDRKKTRKNRNLLPFFAIFTE